MAILSSLASPPSTKQSQPASTASAAALMQQDDISSADKATKRVQLVLRQGLWDELNDPVSNDGASSLPMPVEIATQDSLAPFFGHLRQGGTHLMPETQADDARTGIEAGSDVQLIEYPKGVLYSDGRLDLCKMVVGPTHIEELMDSLRHNTFVKHFLLGNNIIGLVGARAIARFVVNLPDRIETWFLAGNCINHESLNELVDSWVKSPVVTNIWLKRNPLGSTAARDLARLVRQSPQLRTLDLDQTSLGDQGVADLFAYLAEVTDRTLPLKHIYLNATGIGKLACEQIGRFLASPNCALESLYMACNPIGDAVSLLAEGLQKNRSLQRISLSSSGLNSASLAPVIEAVCRLPDLRMLSLGQAFATEDLGARYNWITDESVPLLSFMIQMTKLQYLDLGEVAISQAGLDELRNAIARSDSVLYFDATSIYADRSNTLRHSTALQAHCKAHLDANVLNAYGCSYDDFLHKHKRFLVSSADVRLIDSVYRNRDAGLARRGLKVLDKHWQDGDDTAIKAELGQL